jgi:hypothetical protein
MRSFKEKLSSVSKISPPPSMTLEKFDGYRWLAGRDSTGTPCNSLSTSPEWA